VNGCSSAPKTADDEFQVVDEEASNQFKGVDGTAVTEVRYGNKIYLEIRAANVVCDDDRIQDYLRALREKLVPYVERETLPYLITVVNDERIYAVSTPGGYIYISLGMLNFVDSESALAAVLAHEMAQTQYKPQRFRLTKVLFGFFRSLVRVASFVFFPGYGVSAGLKAVDRYVLKDISVEKAVIRADALAIEYLDKAGYRMSGYADMLDSFLHYNANLYNRLKVQLGNRPLTDKRIAAVKELLKPYDLEEERKAREIQSYNKVNAYVDGLIASLP
jgi:predicted Zn-dependent protease